MSPIFLEFNSDEKTNILQFLFCFLLNTLNKIFLKKLIDTEFFKTLTTENYVYQKFKLLNILEVFEKIKQQCTKTFTK
ncbi:hypothetical protein BpHYR1_008703 [Brachionus plicatilis]|uniref:Uncharacterized protein n=1 Tax=Brachionus plicatilis TaxID=10195 RepID=A0A3M7TAR5_BRAPC|nr:hypothetical protein BpHYR1_008703 [Brachionus plicatilis]